MGAGLRGPNIPRALPSSSLFPQGSDTDPCVVISLQKVQKYASCFFPSHPQQQTQNNILSSS